MFDGCGVLFVVCLLFVVVVRCSWFVVGCLMVIGCSESRFVFVCCSLLVVCCLLSVV